MYTELQVRSLINGLRDSFPLANIGDRLGTFRDMVIQRLHVDLKEIDNVGVTESNAPLSLVKDITSFVNEIHGSEFKITLTLEPKGFYEEK